MMPAINDLVIRGPHHEVPAFLQRLEAGLNDGWRRDHEREAFSRNKGVVGEDTFCFTCTDAPDRPAVTISLHARGHEEWYVFNIIPVGKHKLSDEEYNRFLDEFKSRFLDPMSRGSAVHAEILPYRIRSDYYMSSEAERLLREFSTESNRTTLHPSDRKRRQQFLFCARRDGAIIDTACLQEWLASEGWPEEMRAELARDYESTRDLLWNYDEENRR